MSILLIHSKVSVSFNSECGVAFPPEYCILLSSVCVYFEQVFICEACLCLDNMIVCLTGHFVTDD